VFRFLSNQLKGIIMKNFTGSNPTGHKAEIRSTDSIDYRTGEDGFSVFTWHDSNLGLCLWREKHGLSWDEAFATAQSWLK
jgi:hypothetical protein